jgi:hypothetical protein
MSTLKLLNSCQAARYLNISLREFLQRNTEISHILVNTTKMYSEEELEKLRNILKASATR